MESSSLFNPGFLGSSFNWWIGQIPDDSYWRDNITPTKFEGPDGTTGWGYRYKVRILGLHDRDEETIPSDQLPWAQVMYPVCLLYTSPSPRDKRQSRMPSSA